MSRVPDSVEWRVVDARSGRIMQCFRVELNATTFASAQPDPTYVEHKYPAGWGTWSRIEDGQVAYYRANERMYDELFSPVRGGHRFQVNQHKEATAA